jgi:hypothetical protein
MPTKGRRAYRGRWERRQPTSRVVQVNDGAASHDGGAVTVHGLPPERLLGFAYRMAATPNADVAMVVFETVAG